LQKKKRPTKKQLVLAAHKKENTRRKNGEKKTTPNRQIQSEPQWILKGAFYPFAVNIFVGKKWGNQRETPGGEGKTDRSQEPAAGTGRNRRKDSSRNKQKNCARTRPGNDWVKCPTPENRQTGRPCFNQNSRWR